MNPERPLGQLHPRWDRGLVLMVGCSLAVHLLLVVAVLFVMRRSGHREPPGPLTAYTVELTDGASLGQGSQNLIPGAPGRKLDGGDPGPRPATKKATAVPPRAAVPEPTEPPRPEPPKTPPPARVAEAVLPPAVAEAPVAAVEEAAVELPEPKKVATPTPPSPPEKRADAEVPAAKPVEKPPAPKPVEKTPEKPVPKKEDAPPKPAVAQAKPTPPHVPPSGGTPTKAAAAPAESTPATSAAAPAVAGPPAGGRDASSPEDRYAAAIERVRKRAGEGGLGGNGDPNRAASIGGSGSGGGGQVVGTEFLIYYNIILTRIRQAWLWAGHNDNLQVTVRFVITPQGEIEDVAIDRSSGDVVYDQSVIRAVEGANPLPPPPPAHLNDFSRVELTFRPGDFRAPG